MEYRIGTRGVQEVLSTLFVHSNGYIVNKCLSGPDVEIMHGGGTHPVDKRLPARLRFHQLRIRFCIHAFCIRSQISC
jgi:hypothetical protein